MRPRCAILKLTEMLLKLKTISMKLKDINAEVERLYDNWAALHAKMDELFVAGNQNNHDQA